MVKSFVFTNQVCDAFIAHVCKQNFDLRTLKIAVDVEFVLSFFVVLNDHIFVLVALSRQIHNHLLVN